LGFRLTLLITLIAVLFRPPHALAAKPSCLGCHKPHYEVIGTCVDCHRGNAQTDRLAIAHHDLIPGRFAKFTLGRTPAVERGRKLLETFACRRCHIITGKGNRLAADLDGLLSARQPQLVFDAIRTPPLFMPDFRFDDRQIIDLVNALLAGAKQGGAKGAEKPAVVHFDEGKQTGKNPFVMLCGQCHKALTEKFGGLGKGDFGPNLSGLFSLFYPETFRDRAPWRGESLRKWLANPRRLRPNARMQPILLKAGELQGLADILRVTRTTPGETLS
jgi:cytochrome c2